MFVVATAGHVDHGKSTLVRALTGMEPDRWAEERDRGLTIDLGFVWTGLPSGRHVAFVDVPGHERFLGNMLAGLGPAPVVCFIVAADEGWQAQSTDHRDAVAALGIEHGLVVLTRADRADQPRRDEVLAQVRTELAGTPLADAPAVTVSAVTGEGIDDLRAALDDVLASAPAPDPDERVRMWIDRSFTIKGAGTVVTGTLAAGTLVEGGRLELIGREAVRPVTIRALHSQNRSHPEIGPVNRVAVNLRGESADDIHRGDVLVSPGAWSVVDTVDVRRTTGTPLSDGPQTIVVHTGTVAVEAQLRPFSDDHARLTLDRRLPLELGDRFVLRGSGSRSVLAGVQVLDVDPPELTRRGDGRRRGEALAGMNPAGDAVLEVTRRGFVRVDELTRMGLELPAEAPARITAFGPWWVDSVLVDTWRGRLREAVEQLDPLSPGLSRGAARDLISSPDDVLLDAVVAAAGLEQEGGHIRQPGRKVDLGPAEKSVATIEGWLRDEPFAAPDANELTDLKLGAKQLAAAERAGRILRLADGVVLLPDAPRKAVATLRQLDQPFTTSQARKALDTSRRIAIPLLEHMDELGLTRRVDAGNRIVVGK
ncbi:selenocysteine-specific translation elongation factor [Corynebacterium halotolerans]|uniref:Selenocysteine-specific translation elongation factor n=1 Tax=Corynebacterium halotolerans YIM 70093 = DSM 44683 TaxID=1121362 RepID=M1P612_9CORY|nr:selenocysteine-specific translation elongation factor [Corynebacterium halotolerans]AGF72076.1 selenocysteine-specific translation elongation factor [Corynebacterium halotolerans YIM 70093 = DSM 44683]